MACPVYREELERRAQMWAQGMSAKQMAEECCVSVDAITSYASYHREHFPHRHVTTIVGDAEERERARVMRADGMTYKAIAKTLGRSRSTVRQWCNGADMTGNKFCPTCGVKFVGNGPSE